MTLSDVFYDLFETAFEVLERKNRDYCGKSDALANLRACEALGVDARIGVLVRMSDKIGRLSNVCRTAPSVADESIRDTVIDLINYAVLFYALHLDKHAKEASACSMPHLSPAKP